MAFNWSNIVAWIKTNKLLTVVLLVAVYFVYANSWKLQPVRYSTPGGIGGAPSIGVFEDSANQKSFSAEVDVQSAGRKVITDSQVSLLVKDVRQALNAIKARAESIGGYMVNLNVYSPIEAANGDIAVRIPLDNREEFLGFLRDLGVRVVNETINAYDVTDQYTDLDAELQTLQATQQKLQAIFDQAETVDELLAVQERLIQNQRRIDSVIGQIRYLETTTSTTLITVNVSTDELALPYTPEDPWRPTVIF